MGFTQFPSMLYAKVSETDEIFMAAGFTPGASQQLRHMVLTMYHAGTAAGTERFRLKLFHDRALTKLYATGDWLELASIDGLSDSWLGRVRFDFSDPWLNQSFTYYVALEADGYTRAADTRFVAWVLDWPLPVNSQNDTPSYAVSFEAYGLRSLPP